MLVYKFEYNTITIETDAGDFIQSAYFETELEAAAYFDQFKFNYQLWNGA